MDGSQRNLLTLALVATLGSNGLPAQEQPSAREVRPSYSRARVERNETPEPETHGLPETLRVAAPRDRPAGPPGGHDRDDPGAVDTRTESSEPARNDAPGARAEEAAAWAAAETIDRYGLPRYFEVGFHDGQRDAFRRTRHDRWELDQGRRAGRFDPEALGLGEEIGRQEVQLAAAEVARRQVMEQFADLGHEPLRLAPPPPPPFAPPAITVAGPELRDVFQDLSWRGRRASGFRDLRLDPWRLHSAGGHGDFYSQDWRTARFALDLWRRGSRGSREWRRLDAAERRLFDERFVLAFEAELARRFSRVADRAFDRGYDAGWRHGIRIGREWRYRQGYHQGFESGTHETAQEVFLAEFRPAWQFAYEDLFREWSTTIKLEARSARLRDGNDDGVFEPGEQLFADLELINVGGGSGRLDAALDGAVLARPTRRPIEVERRSPVHRFEPLAAVILPTVSPGTDGQVTVSIGEFNQTLPLRVSHVLWFEGGPQLVVHDAVQGTASVDVSLANASRRAVVASLDAGVGGGALRRPHRELRQIPSGAVRRVRFEIHGVHPLDLIAGDVVLSVVSEIGGRTQARLDANLPELATDLDDRSLVDYLLWLAHSPEIDPRDVGRAHELMLRRLEADWREAVQEDGNRYKRDLRNGSSSTALGELVAAARGQGDRAIERRVLADLVPRIDELSRSLPGTHPFLRRSMRKLARQLL